MHVNTSNGLTYLDAVDVRSAKIDGYKRNPYASGYGKRIPARDMVLLPDMRWRRIYVACYSNAGTAGLSVGGRMVIVGPEAEYRIQCIIKSQS